MILVDLKAKQTLPKLPMLSFLMLILLSGYGSYNSIDTFYNAHKNDNQAKIVTMPRFMLGMLGQISPKMNVLIGNTIDL